jgi:hypothetical protein
MACLRCDPHLHALGPHQQAQRAKGAEGPQHAHLRERYSEDGHHNDKEVQAVPLAAEVGPACRNNKRIGCWRGGPWADDKNTNNQLSTGHSHIEVEEVEGGHMHASTCS